MLHKEFVPHAESYELKELGFDEPCFGYYDSEGLQVRLPALLPVRGEIFWNGENKNSLFVEPEKTNNPKISAPTFSQCFRWFRDKHDLIAGIFPNNHSLSNKPSYISYVGKFKKGTIEVCSNYEEAELACLRKLIEIVKKQITL